MKGGRDIRYIIVFTVVDSLIAFCGLCQAYFYILKFGRGVWANRSAKYKLFITWLACFGSICFIAYNLWRFFILPIPYELGATFGLILLPIEMIIASNLIVLMVFKGYATLFSLVLDGEGLAMYSCLFRSWVILGTTGFLAVATFVIFINKAVLYSIPITIFAAEMTSLALNGIIMLGRMYEKIKSRPVTLPGFQQESDPTPPPAPKQLSLKNASLIPPVEQKAINGIPVNVEGETVWKGSGGSGGSALSGGSSLIRKDEEVSHIDMVLISNRKQYLSRIKRRIVTWLIVTLISVVVAILVVISWTLEPESRSLESSLRNWMDSPRGLNVLVISILHIFFLYVARLESAPPRPRQTQVLATDSIPITI